jgi:hypothetical protein
MIGIGAVCPTAWLYKSITLKLSRTCYICSIRYIYKFNNQYFQGDEIESALNWKRHILLLQEYLFKISYITVGSKHTVIKNITCILLNLSLIILYNIIIIIIIKSNLKELEYEIEDSF